MRETKGCVVKSVIRAIVLQKVVRVHLIVRGKAAIAIGVELTVLGWWGDSNIIACT